jgi:hypothetical protein
MKIIYFTRVNGRQPAREWIKDQDKKIKASIFGKIDDLSKEGLSLLDTNALVAMRRPPGLYELRNVSLNWRIGVYYDMRYNAFVLLSGWHHDQNHEKEHQKEIDKARGYLREYLQLEK